jgi:hypothetical protein
MGCALLGSDIVKLAHGRADTRRGVTCDAGDVSDIAAAVDVQRLPEYSRVNSLAPLWVLP